MQIPMGYIGKTKAEKTIRNALTNKNYSCGKSKEISYGLQFFTEKKWL